MKYSSLLAHFAAAIITTGIILLIYASVQQSHRATANDPQLQMARDLSNALRTGRPASNLLVWDTVDLTQSLGTFAEIFDPQGQPIHSTGFLNGQLPQPPAGVFDFTRDNYEDVITWQPQNNVRLAMVFEKVNGAGFVAVGRSLKEVEVRESNLLRMIGITWIACMTVLLMHYLVQRYFANRPRNAAK